MAKIISLGCAVSDVYHRYAEVHSGLFGAQSYRLIVDALTRKQRRTYRKCGPDLEELEGRLTALEADISGIAKQELSSRASGELPQVLLQYMEALRAVIARLKGICRHLADDEAGYRDAAAGGHSRFNKDKVDYDHAIRHLERVGTRLNQLFSTY